MFFVSKYRLQKIEANVYVGSSTMTGACKAVKI